MASDDAALILVVDDEPMMRDMVGDALAFAGYRVVTAAEGAAAVTSVRAEIPDLVVLDVNLPGADGFEVAGRLRAIDDTLPVLFLTARGGIGDVRAGFEAGGDDYLTKPFRLEELRLRIDAILRRTGTGSDSRIWTCADLVVDDRRHQVSRDGETIRLTPTEYRLLRYLAQNAGNVVTPDQILAAVWGYGYGRSVLETAISQLRQKVDNRRPKLIHTVRGFGYSLRTSDVGCVG